MKIACVYTVERAADERRPLSYAIDIPFGLSIIATLLRQDGHDVDLFVFSSRSDAFRTTLESYVACERPQLFCLTAVSTQFPFVRRIASFIKELDPRVFVALGGHHASLDTERTAATMSLDAICVGEGDRAVVELAHQLAAGERPSRIPHLWLRSEDGSFEKNPPLAFELDLDALPYIDRSMWEPWIAEPDRHPSILLGRGCPFRCTYCSSHAMQALSEGRFVRFRSPANIIGEIEQICERYPQTDSIYLEVETIAHQREAVPLFEQLATWNAQRTNRIGFGLNFTVTSTFIRDEARCRSFLSLLRDAGVTYLNIGLESGSERLRREVLRRPRYTNDEFILFADLAREYLIVLDFYVLIGVPGETLADYAETVRLVRRTNPEMVFLSIFYPYLGTDLYKVALDAKLVAEARLDVDAERARAALDLPGFSRRRVRVEYGLFWWRAFRGRWPLSRIVVETLKSLINGSPHLWPLYRDISRGSRIYAATRALYRSRLRGGTRGEVRRPGNVELTYES